MELRCTGTAPRPRAGAARALQAFRLAALIGLLAITGSAPEAQGTDATARKAPAYPLERLNTGLPQPPPSLELRTPQAALEHFLGAARGEDYVAAAHALNLNAIPARRQEEAGAELAQELAFVLQRKLPLDWREIPDRPDGRLPLVGAASESRPREPRREFLVGTLALDGRDAEIWLERVEPEGAEPVWVFASGTVQRIHPLYERYGPGLLYDLTPSWARSMLWGPAEVWQWLALLGLIALSIWIGVLLQRAVRHLMRNSERVWVRGLASEITGPAALFAGLLVLYVALQTLLTLTGPFAATFSVVLVILMIASLTWMGMRVIHFFSEYIGKNHVDNLASRDEARARQHLTYISVARRAFIFVALLVGVGVALSQFSPFRIFGTSLLASAGVASIILGIAAQDVLSNIMAGVQIAITQPVRIGDTVYFENEWGYIEDITYTFVILRTWDQRRVAVPNQYVISNPIENWEMANSHLIMSVTLFVDYRTEVDAVRRKYVELLEASEEWDREQEPLLQVVAMREDVLELRALCSAQDPLAAWSLHCRLREDLVVFLREFEGGRFLPRRRLLVDGAGPTERDRP